MCLIYKQISSIAARWKIPIGCIILAIAFSPCYLSLATFVYQEVKISYERELVYKQGDQLAEALIKFQSKNGYYPTQLSELLPDYLETLPEHPRGWPFEYEPINGEFVLTFGIPTHFPGWPTGRICNSKNGSVACYHLRYYPEVRGNENVESD